MNATIIFITIILVLYLMKVISFDFDLLKTKFSNFKTWCAKAYAYLKTKFNSFIDFFNKKTGNVD